MSSNGGKTKAGSSVSRYLYEDTSIFEEPTTDMTPECLLCGEEHVGIAEDAILLLQGQWFQNIEFDVPVFLLDPDTKLRILEMPNGQLALVPDTLRGPSQHAHKICLEQLAEEFLEEYGTEDMLDDEDD